MLEPGLALEHIAQNKAQLYTNSIPCSALSPSLCHAEGFDNTQYLIPDILASMPLLLYQGMGTACEALDLMHIAVMQTSSYGFTL